MPSGVEQYGVITGIDPEVLARLQNGFDTLRQVEGWEEFRIPSYVWTYVDAYDRDFILNYAYQSMYVKRTLETHFATLTADQRDAVFAFWYTICIYLEWWLDNPDRPDPYTLRDMINPDMGIPESALIVTGVYSSYISFDRWIFPFGSGDYDADDVKFEADYYNGLPEVSTYFGDYESIRTIQYRGSMYTSTHNYWLDYEWSKFYKDADKWNDLGIEASWTEDDLMNASLKCRNITQDIDIDVISASAEYSTFGAMRGSIELKQQPNNGDVLQIRYGETYYATGVVTSCTQELASGVYRVTIADPVTAQGGEAVYTSGNAIAALQEAIENAGGTFETSMSTTETVFYPTQPQDFWQFARCVCYAVGGVLQYGHDGVYRLVAAEDEHSITDDDLIADDNPTIQENPNDYANYVQVSVDATWTEPATETTVDTYSVAGNSISIIRLGEQIQSMTVSYDSGAGKTVTYTYDENDYLTGIDETHQTGSGVGDTKYERTVTFTNISDDGNRYDVDIVEKTYQYNQSYDPDTMTYSNGWLQVTENTQNWKVDLNSLSKVEEVQKGLELIAHASWKADTMYYDANNPDGVKRTSTVSIPISTDDYTGWPQLVNQYKWIASIISAPDADVLEGYCTSEQYNYVVTRIEADSYGLPVARLGWARVNPSMAQEKTFTIPQLEVCAAENEKEVHIIAGAKDPASIAVLGEHKYETQAIALDTDTGMQNFALGVLKEKSRVRTASISVSLDLSEIKPLDIVYWRNKAWVVQSVMVDMDTWTQYITMSTQSMLIVLCNSIMKAPTTWVEDVKNAINKRTAQFHNISRGKVVSRVGKRRYLVQAEGSMGVVEAKALSDDPIATDATVLLVRPTGKNQQWTLLSLSKEDPVSLPAVVQENVTPTDEQDPGITSFEADITDPLVGETVTLSWNIHVPVGWSFITADVDDGTGNITNIADAGTTSLAVSYDRDAGTSITPTLTATLQDQAGISHIYGPVEIANGSLELNYLDMTLAIDEDTPWTGLEVTTTITTAQTGNDSSISITSVRSRSDTAAAWDDLGAGATSTSYTYDTAGSYTIGVELTYANGRGASETLYGEVPITVWEAWSGLTYNATDGLWYATFPVNGAYDVTWDIAGQWSAAGPGQLIAEGLGGNAMNFTLEYGVNDDNFEEGNASAKYLYLTVPHKYRPSTVYGETEYIAPNWTNGEFINSKVIFRITGTTEGLIFESGYAYEGLLGESYVYYLPSAVTLDTYATYPYALNGRIKLEYTAPTDNDGKIAVYWNDVYKGDIIMDVTPHVLFRWYSSYTSVNNPVSDKARLFKDITIDATNGNFLYGPMRLQVPTQQVAIIPGSADVYLLPGSPREFTWVKPEDYTS